MNTTNSFSFCFFVRVEGTFETFWGKPLALFRGAQHLDRMTPLRSNDESIPSTHHFRGDSLTYFLQQTVIWVRHKYYPHFYVQGNWDSEVKWLAQSRKSLKRILTFLLHIPCLWSFRPASPFWFLHINMHVGHLLPERQVHLHQGLKLVPETCFY